VSFPGELLADDDVWRESAILTQSRSTHITVEWLTNVRDPLRASVALRKPVSECSWKACCPSWAVLVLCSRCPRDTWQQTRMIQPRRVSAQPGAVNRFPGEFC